MKRETTYESWIRQEGIPVVEGYGVEDVREVPLRPWARTGGQGALIQLKGMEGFTGMYVGEISPGAALSAERHLFEELIYILQGVGSTEVWSGQGERRKVHFEWQEGSLFAIPLNSWHRLINGSQQPALFLVVTSAPLGKYPLGIVVALNRAGVRTSTREGGTLIEYQDEDPQIRRDYEAALKKEGVSIQMPSVVAREGGTL